MPKVSIITPVKAVKDVQVGWFVEMIESVRAQQMRDWELIIVDDSSDASLAPIKPHVLDDGRIHAHTLRNTGGSGVAAARNFGVEKSTTPFLLPVDADDKLPPNALNRFLWAWHNGGQQAGLVYSNVLMFGVDFQRHYKAPEYDFRKLLSATLMVVGCLHRKADWQRIGGWDATMDGGLEDWEYWIRMGAVGVCGHHIAEELYHYRRHSVGRLATLKLEPRRWQRQYRQMRELHQDLYNGRFPVGCCGSASTSSKPASMHSKPAPAATPVHGGVAVEYTGGRKGSFGMRSPSGQRYRIPGHGAVLQVKQIDVQFFLNYGGGKSFRRADR